MGNEWCEGHLTYGHLTNWSPPAVINNGKVIFSVSRRTKPQRNNPPPSMFPASVNNPEFAAGKFPFISPELPPTLKSGAWLRCGSAAYPPRAPVAPTTDH